MNKKDYTRNAYMLKGALSDCGYDWWWHSFTAVNHKSGEEKPFYIEFYVINPALTKTSGSKPIFGQRPGEMTYTPPSYVMVNVGCWGEKRLQLHRFFPACDLQADTKREAVRVKDCYLSENITYGHVDVSKEEVISHPEYKSDAGSISWYLKINKQVAFHVGYGANAFFRKLNAFDMFWHAQGMKTEYEGKIYLDGERYDVIPEKSYGYADKNWGRDFTSPWVWISSCHMKSLRTGKVLKNSVFDIGGGRPVVFGVPLDRKLLSNLWYEGRDLEFNFSKFWTLTDTKFDFENGTDEAVWHVTTQNAGYLLKLVCHCKKSDMIKIRYEAPNGEMKHKNLYNGGNGYGCFALYRKTLKGPVLIDKVVFKNAGCEYGEY